MLAECYHYHLDDILWRMTLNQALALLNARAKRIEKQNREQEERRNNPDGLTNAELRRKHREARDTSNPDNLPSFDEILQGLGMR